MKIYTIVSEKCINGASMVVNKIYGKFYFSIEIGDDYIVPVDGVPHEIVEVKYTERDKHEKTMSVLQEERKDHQLFFSEDTITAVLYPMVMWGIFENGRLLYSELPSEEKDIMVVYRQSPYYNGFVSYTGDNGKEFPGYILHKGYSSLEDLYGRYGEGTQILSLHNEGDIVGISTKKYEYFHCIRNNEVLSLSKKERELSRLF